MIMSFCADISNRIENSVRLPQEKQALLHVTLKIPILNKNPTPKKPECLDSIQIKKEKGRKINPTHLDSCENFAGDGVSCGI